MKNTNTRVIFAAMLASSMLLTGCTAGTDSGDFTASLAAVTEESGVEELLNESLDSALPSVSNSASVAMGESIEINGKGAIVSEEGVEISLEGEYTLSGTLSGKAIVVNAPDGNVILRLSGVSVSNAGCAIYIAEAKNVYIFAEEGTVNVLSSTGTYTENTESDEDGVYTSGGCIYSKSDIFFCGGGTINVNAENRSGIIGKDDLEVLSGTVNVEAGKNGIRGKDSVIISGGTVNITALKDGIKSDNDTDSEKGRVEITGGNVSVTATEDGIQAETAFLMSGGEVSVTTLGEVESATDNMDFGGMIFGGQGANSITADSGVVQTTETAESAASEESEEAQATEEATSKGIKAGVSLVISGGELSLTTTDHAIHCAGTIDITDGAVNISSDNKGISAHGDLTVDGGEITIAKCTEGIESKAALTINDGVFHITSSDDGINAGGGSAFAFMGGGNMHQRDNIGFGGTVPTMPDGAFTAENGEAPAMPDGAFTAENGEAPTMPNGALTAENGEAPTMPDGAFTAENGEAPTMPENETTAADGETSETHIVTINGGYIWIESDGDGIDSNTDLIINGGTLLINGAPTGAETALDASEGNYEINGGFLIGIGAAGLLETPQTTDDCEVIHIVLDSAQQAGTTICIRNTATGEVIAAYTAPRGFQAIDFTSEKLEAGAEYEIILGATIAGEETDGLFAEGAAIEGGTVAETITLTAGVNSIGNASAAMGVIDAFISGNEFGGKGFDGTITLPSDVVFTTADGEAITVPSGASFTLSSGIDFRSMSGGTLTLTEDTEFTTADGELITVPAGASAEIDFGFGAMGGRDNKWGGGSIDGITPDGATAPTASETSAA